MQEHVETVKNKLFLPQSFLFFRDGRMLFDYLADKHGVSNSTVSSTVLRSSHDFFVNSALFWGANGRGGPEHGDVKWLPKTLTHFQGFYGLQKFLRTFTFCGELLRINWTAQDPWVWPQKCLGILYLTWRHSPPTPTSHWPGACPQCTSIHRPWCFYCIHTKVIHINSFQKTHQPPHALQLFHTLHWQPLILTLVFCANVVINFSQPFPKHAVQKTLVLSTVCCTMQQCHIVNTLIAWYIWVF